MHTLRRRFPLRLFCLWLHSAVVRMDWGWGVAVA